MAFTAKLGISDSAPGNVVPGLGATTSSTLTGIAHRVSQQVVEYIEASPKTIRSSQQVVEYIETSAKTIRFSQVIVEYLMRGHEVSIVWSDEFF